MSNIVRADQAFASLVVISYVLVCFLSVSRRRQFLVPRVTKLRASDLIRSAATHFVRSNSSTSDVDRFADIVVSKAYVDAVGTLMEPEDIASDLGVNIVELGDLVGESLFYTYGKLKDIENKTTGPRIAGSNGTPVSFY